MSHAVRVAGGRRGGPKILKKFNSGFRVRRSDGKVWDLSCSIFYFVVLRVAAFEVLITGDGRFERFDWAIGSTSAVG